jgi:hypothetical protein
MASWWKLPRRHAPDNLVQGSGSSPGMPCHHVSSGAACRTACLAPHRIPAAVLHGLARRVAPPVGLRLEAALVHATGQRPGARGAAAAARRLVHPGLHVAGGPEGREGAPISLQHHGRQVICGSTSNYPSRSSHHHAPATMHHPQSIHGTPIGSVPPRTQHRLAPASAEPAPPSACDCAASAHLGADHARCLAATLSATASRSSCLWRSMAACSYSRRPASSPLVGGELSARALLWPAGSRPGVA